MKRSLLCLCLLLTSLNSTNPFDFGSLQKSAIPGPGLGGGAGDGT